MGLCPVEFVVRKREPRGNIMNQTKRQSFIEAVFNTLIGLLLHYFANCRISAIRHTSDIRD